MHSPGLQAQLEHGDNDQKTCYSPDDRDSRCAAVARGAAAAILRNRGLKGLNDISQDVDPDKEKVRTVNIVNQGL